MSFLYLDNNILRHLFNLDKDEFELLFDPVFRTRVFSEDGYRFKSSPYLVLEAIGIRPTFISDVKAHPPLVESIKENSKNKKNKKVLEGVESLIKKLFEDYHALIVSSPRLGMDYLKEKFDKQKQFVNRGMWIFEEVVGQHLSDVSAYIEILHSWFAFEKVLGQAYPKSICRDVFAYQMNTANTFFVDARNNSFAKIYLSIAKDLSDEILRRDTKAFYNRVRLYRKMNLQTKKLKVRRTRFHKLITFKAKIQKRRRAIKQIFSLGKYGQSRDNVDSEIVHLLLFGSSHGETGGQKPVVVASTDRIEVIAARVSLYKSVVRGAWALRNEKPLSLCFGHFFLFDSTDKRISKWFSAESIPAFFDLYDYGVDFNDILRDKVMAL
ncbi:MAG: hypothetical protein HYV97_12285 [Bdellovibrio sp.]|nr:hypothetical protein [Bdellovibrio sp.]